MLYFTIYRHFLTSFYMRVFIYGLVWSCGPHGKSTNVTHDQPLIFYI